MAEKEIPKQNYDIVFKAMTEQFGQKALHFYGIDTAPIVRVEPTDLPRIDVNERRMDFVFSLSDNSYLHLEFQTVYHPKDLERFKLYDAALYEKKQRRIHTYVVYGADVTKAEERLDHGSIQYRARTIYMNGYNGDQIFKKLADKVHNRETLTDEDQLELIFLPLMNTKKDRTDLATAVVELVSQIEDEAQRFRLTGTTVGIADKFLDDSYVNKMMEVFKMTRIAQKVHDEGVAEGRQEGMQQGRQEMIRKYLIARFGPSSSALQEKVRTMDLTDPMIEDIFLAETLEEVEKLIK